jgi:Staphylococcal nuclease homologue
MLAAAALLMFMTPAHADIAGVGSVIDADTIEIYGQRIRLYGIDAPESCQTCTDASGRAWRCGQRAALALQVLIARRTVSCQPRDTDRYGRIVARCQQGDIDIGQWLVGQGLALAYAGTRKPTSRPSGRPLQRSAGCGPARSRLPGIGAGSTARAGESGNLNGEDALATASEPGGPASAACRHQGGLQADQESG